MNKKIIFPIVFLLFFASCARKNINHELFYAAAKGDASRVADCLSKGADPASTDPADKGDNPDYGPMTALEAAVRANSVDCAKLLYAKGARLEEGSEALHNLVQSEDPDLALIELIAGQKDQLNAADLGGDTPMNLAVRKGAGDIVHILLSYGAVYTDAAGKNLGNKRAVSDAEKNAKDNPLSFSGAFTGGFLGFEGDGYYFSFKSTDGKAKEFRADRNPEMAFFVISEQMGMPAENSALIGKKFRVWYWRGVEVDVRGETVPVNRYIHAEVLED